MKMENSLSDVEFGDSDGVGALILGGACILCGVIGYSIKAFFGNKDGALARKEIAELKALLIPAAPTRATAASGPAPVAAPAAA